MAMDWTFDKFVEDMNKYNATPIKGVYPSSTASYEEKFITWFKNCVRDFKNEWMAEHNGCLYDRYEGWAGDAFARELGNMCFSDFYKDTYNQRPHLATWYYIHLTGLPMSEDTCRTFCARPIEDAQENAKRVREYYESI